MEAKLAAKRCVGVDESWRYTIGFAKWLDARGHNADAWVDALFLTIVEMLRDLHVRATGRGWLELSVVERRAVYSDVVRRVFRNRCPPGSFTSSIEQESAEAAEAIEGILAFLMVRDEEIPFEPICG